MRSRFNATDSASGATVPARDPSAPIRDLLAERYPEVERARPAVLDDVAELVVGLAEGLHGRASATAGVRSAAYRRQQLRGEHSISLTDLCQLAQDAPEAVATALRPLLARLGYQLAPLPAAPVSLVQTCAQVAHAAGEAVSEGLEAAEDGLVDAAEALRIDRAALVLERAAAELRAGAHRARQASSQPLERVVGR